LERARGGKPNKTTEPFPKWGSTLKQQTEYKDFACNRGERIHGLKKGKETEGGGKTVKQTGKTRIGTAKFGKKKDKRARK